MSINLKKWLSVYLEIKQEELDNIIQPDNALSFMIVWTIFESKCFNGFVKVDIFDKFIQQNKQKLTLAVIEPSISHFHARYQASDLYRHLKYGDKNSEEVDAILKKDYVQLLDEEKLKLILYVIYRYRNNLFHGNKNIVNWGSYKEQFNHCISCLTYFIDQGCKVI